MIAATSLNGVWELASFALEDAQGARRPWGREMRGLLIYQPSGHMSIAINKKIEASDGGEAQDTLDAMLFYSGMYRIDGDKIVHSVEVASDPDRVGKDLSRIPTLEGTILRLVSPQQDWGRSILEWRKIV